MYKDRGLSLAAEEKGSLYREVVENKKRSDDVVDKPTPSTSKGGNGREKLVAPAAAAAAHPRRFSGHEVRPAAPEKAKYPDDGESNFFWSRFFQNVINLR